jgi:hypothetical protein
VAGNVHEATRDRRQARRQSAFGCVHLGDAIVRVVYRGKSKATQVGGSPPETIAGMLLRELVWESRHH